MSSMTGRHASKLSGARITQNDVHRRRSRGSRMARPAVIQARGNFASWASSLLKPTGQKERPRETLATLLSKGGKGDTFQLIETCHSPFGAESSNLDCSELCWEPFKPKEYVVLGKLGKGSYGTVWRATREDDASRNAEVAIKVLPKERIKSPRSLVLKKIQREVDILEELQASSSIPVRLLGRFEDGERAYIVTEVVGGDTLQRIFERGAEFPVKRLNEDQLVRLCHDMLRFLACCHEKRVVYGDVKPANLICPGVDGSVRVVDFGCSQILPEGEHLRGRCGTPAYWAPEVFHKQYDTKADIWSLGIVMYQLVTGKYPWFENLKKVVPRDVLYSIEHEEVPYVRSEWSHVSPEFRDLVFRMLEKDPSKRSSAEDALAHPALSSNMTTPSKCIAASSRDRLSRDNAMAMEDSEDSELAAGQAAELRSSAMYYN